MRTRRSRTARSRPATSATVGRRVVAPSAQGGRALGISSLLKVALVVVVAAFSSAVATAGPYTVKSLEVISAPTPFATGCAGALFDETHIAGAEIEPFVTVNPANSRNIVATWQQDLGFAARSDLIGTSRD